MNLEHRGTRRQLAGLPSVTMPASLAAVGGAARSSGPRRLRNWLRNNERAQLKRLCRYLALPPLSHDRLSLLPEGLVQVALKSTWSDGTQAVVLSPLD